MPPDSHLDPATVRAYLETQYRVLGEQPFALRIGERSAPLLAAHASRGVDTSAFVTACNPYSRVLDACANELRQVELARALRLRGLPFLPGIGVHPANRWPGEESLLVFGISLEEAKVLGASVEQNAIVWCAADGIPRLILLC